MPWGGAGACFVGQTFLPTLQTPDNNNIRWIFRVRMPCHMRFVIVRYNYMLPLPQVLASTRDTQSRGTSLTPSEVLQADLASRVYKAVYVIWCMYRIPHQPLSGQAWDTFRAFPSYLERLCRLIYNLCPTLPLIWVEGNVRRRLPIADAGHVICHSGHVVYGLHLDKALDTAILSLLRSTQL
jgi:hypothetical protein